MSSYVYRLFCKSLLHIHNMADDDDVGNIEICPEN